MTADAFAQAALLERGVAVCVGCGGVGKTTLAAALAFEAARRGRRALVLTIDPARRLADSLGVNALGNRPQDLPRPALSALGVPESGNLSALMLDMKRTFDDLVERFAESEEARARILGNRIYQNVSDALSGSVEYAAMEKVFELYETGDFDLLVVDTPPAEHALDFLEAPRRLIEFLDSRLVQMLIHPAFSAGRLGFRVFQRGAGRVLRLIERVSGFGFLEDVSEFLLAFEGMSEGFRSRARRVEGLLLGPRASFVLVTGPGRESVDSTERFLDRLDALGAPLSGVLANRVHRWPGGTPPEDPVLAAGEPALAAALRRADAAYPAEAGARAAVEAVRGYARLVRRDLAATEPLRQRAERRSCYWGAVPELASDVHDLPGLARVADLVFRGGAPVEANQSGDRRAPDAP